VADNPPPMGGQVNRKYYGVRKVVWDQKWHAIWLNEKGCETWDRVNRAEAVRIAAQIFRENQ
jgi:hypothetical protein